MGLYTRADYEQEIQEIEKMSALVNRGVLSGAIPGLAVPRLNTQIELAKRQAWGKLQGTRLLLMDGDAARKARLGKPKGVGGNTTVRIVVLRPKP